MDVNIFLPQKGAKIRKEHDLAPILLPLMILLP
jgi:hypothetical protein